MRLKAIDFFCGGGGMSYGLQQAGIDIIAGIDNDIECKETYEFNITGARFIQADIFQLSINELEQELAISKKDDELVLVGCSPCQYWSIIRTNKEKSKKSKNLLDEFRRFVEDIEPGYVIIENVPGMLSKKKESGLENFINSLEKKNYTISYGVFNTNNYGVPQTRKRFTLIASRITKNKLHPLPSNQTKPVLKDFIGEKNGFPEVQAGTKDKSEFMHTVAGLSKISLERLKRVRKNGGSRFDFADDKKLQLACFVGKDNSFRDTFGRLSWEKPSSTITTKFFSVSNGRFVHPEENRALSLREGATLQTFPKDYSFKTRSIATTARIIGNAVPPEYAKRIGLSIIKSLNEYN